MNCAQLPDYASSTASNPPSNSDDGAPRAAQTAARARVPTRARLAAAAAQ